MQTQTHTVLVHSNHSIHRIDLSLCCASGQSEVLGHGVHQTFANARPADAIYLAASSPKILRSNLWLVTADAWAGKLELDAEIVAQLDSEQLVHALALEAEYDSGFVGSETQLAFVSSANSIGEWGVTQVPNTTVSEIQNAAKQAGCHVSRIAALQANVFDPDQPISPETAIELAQNLLREHFGRKLHCPLLELEDTQRHRRFSRLCYAATTMLLLGAGLTAHRHMLQAVDGQAREVLARDNLSKQLDATHAQLSLQLTQAVEQRAKAEQDFANRQILIAKRQLRARKMQDKGDALVEFLDAMEAASNSAVWVAKFEYSYEASQLEANIAGLAISPFEATLFCNSLNTSLKRYNSRWHVSAESIQSEGGAVSFELKLEKQTSEEAHQPASAQSADIITRTKASPVDETGGGRA